MGMTITEKILSRHAGKDHVEPDELVFAGIDLIMGTDIASPLAIDVFEKMGAEKVFDNDKIALINDHLVPAKDIQAAQLSKMMREFAGKYGITHYFEVGRSGICHNIVPEKGLVLPGDLVIGADSHTCTYGAVGALSTGVGSTDLAASMVLGKSWFRVPKSIKINYTGQLPDMVGGKDIILYTLGKIGVDGARYCAIEFTGDVIKSLEMADRFTICNMAIEAGAKFGVIEADDKTEAYLKDRTARKYDVVHSDNDARYFQECTFDVSDLEPQVAEPYLPSNSIPISRMDKMKIDQVVIGSCTNGRIEDLRIAAEILKDKEVHPSVRLIVIPGSQEIYSDMLKEDLAEIFISCGAAISTPTCGPCIGAHMGILGENEVGLFTTNRNFKGRNGHPTSKVYLCGPAVAAASAITGYITDPRK